MTQIWSGVFEGRTTGTPISILVQNQDQRSRDYGNIMNTYRPGHADYTFDEKYGFRDYRGGGRSSGRETTARVAAGAVAAKILKELGIEVHAYTKAIGSGKSLPDGIHFPEQIPGRLLSYKHVLQCQVTHMPKKHLPIWKNVLKIRIPQEASLNVLLPVCR